jgi:CRP-like cAMP-binding protein
MKPVPSDIKPFTPQKIQTDTPRKGVMAAPEEHLNLIAGQTLFSQGDLGGDLFFIESGSIEIFVSKKGQDIVLATMGVGEVIGVMTLLTSEPRLASARAKESTVVRKIPRTTINKLIASFPKWLGIVMKEFTIRINEMNRRYSEALIELKQVRNNQVTSLFLASQMAQGLVVVGRGMIEKIDGAPVDRHMVVVDALIDSMSRVLNQPREVILRIWQVLRDCGLIEVDKDQARQRDIVSTEQLDKIGIFSRFLRDLSQESNKRLVKVKFRNSELMGLVALVKIMIKNGAKPDESATCEVAKIAAEFEQLVGTPWKSSLIEKPQKLGLMLVRESGTSMTLTFTPRILGQTLSCLAAFKKLSGESDPVSEDPEPPEALPEGA